MMEGIPKKSLIELILKIGNPLFLVSYDEYVEILDYQANLIGMKREEAISNQNSIPVCIQNKHHLFLLVKLLPN